MIKLEHGDCLKLMKNIPTGSIDLILCDPPYGNIKGMQTSGWKRNNNSNQWDNELPINKLFKQYERILRAQGIAIIFSEEPLTSKLRTFNYQNFIFLYPLIWLKNGFANGFIIHKAPLHFFEDLSVFRKKYDSQYKDPLRKYAKHVLNYIGKSKSQIFKDFGNQKLDHFFRINSMQFSIPTQYTYNKLVKKYHLKEMKNYKPYSQLNSSKPVFHTNGLYVSDVFKYNRDYPRYHPTQKPIKLLEKLIKIYTNKNDLVLDNCMGGGSTGVACKLTHRNFIGMELNNHYFNIAKKRINKTNSKQLVGE